MSEMQKLNINALNDVSGGNDGSEKIGWDNVCAHVETGYLALRSAPAYDDSNIKARIQNGESFSVNPRKTSGVYIWAHFNGMDGWVNSNYVIPQYGTLSRTL